MVEARHTPVIVIDGTQVASGILGNLKPVADISLDWGRNSIYDEVPPTTAKVTIIDERGQWATDADLIGKDMIIRTVTGRVLFRGRIARTTIRRMMFWSPALRRNYSAYGATLTAIDRIGDLLDAPAIGPGASPLDAYGPPDAYAQWDAHFRNIAFGSDHWPLQYGVRRISALTAAAAPIVDDITPTAYNAAHAEYSAGEKSLHWQISAIYATGALIKIGYDPQANSLVRLGTATMTGLSLTFTAGAIRLTALDGAHSIPAKWLIVDPDAALESTVQEAIGRVTVTGRTKGDVGPVLDNGTWYAIHPEGILPREATVTVTVPGHSGKTRTLEVATSLEYGAAGAAMTALAQQIAEKVATLNNQLLHPPVTYDFRRHQEARPDVDELFLRTRTTNVPIYFAGSKYNALKNVGPQFQIIAGVLRWNPEREGSELPAGWTHEARVTRAVGTIAGLTINQLVTNPTPTMADYDPEITLGDLGNVTQGAS